MKKCVFASELAAVLGYNKYKPSDEAIQNMLERNDNPKQEHAECEIEKMFMRDFPTFDEDEMNYIKKNFGTISNITGKDNSDDPWEREVIAKSIKIQSIPKEMIEKLAQHSDDPEAVLAYGNVVEKANILTNHCNGENTQMKFKRSINENWLLFGKTDFCENGVITEIKSRVNRIFTYIPKREKIQLISYLWMSQESDNPCNTGVLKQIHGEEEMVSYYSWEVEKEWFEDLLEEFVAKLD